MIRYIKYSEIDKKKWDDCVDNSLNGIVYAYSWYLDIVCKKWDALVEDDYLSIFPLNYWKKSGIFYLYQPFFTQQLGVFSKNILTEEKINEFLFSIPDKFKLIEINLNTSIKNIDKNFSHQKYINLELSLDNSYENIYKNYSKNLKRNIKKAIKNEITIKKDVDPLKIINIFRQNKGKNIKILKDNDYSVLHELINKCVKKGKAEVWGAYTKDNQLCAGVVFVFSNNRIIFLFSGTADIARDNGAMSFIIDRCIKENSSKKIIFDFEGSNNVNLARFYKSFGAETINYLHLNINKLPAIIYKTKNVYKKFKDLIK